MVLEDFGAFQSAVPQTGDLGADLTAWTPSLAKSLTTGDFSAALRIPTVSALEDTDAATRLRTTFSQPLHAAARTRLGADGERDEQVAHATADAIGGDVVYPILNEGSAYDPNRAAVLTRIILGCLPGCGNAATYGGPARTKSLPGHSNTPTPRRGSTATRHRSVGFPTAAGNGNDPVRRHD